MHAGVPVRGLWPTNIQTSDQFLRNFVFVGSEKRGKGRPGRGRRSIQEGQITTKKGKRQENEKEEGLDDGSRHAHG